MRKGVDPIITLEIVVESHILPASTTPAPPPPPPPPAPPPPLLHSRRFFQGFQLFFSST